MQSKTHTDKEIEQLRTNSDIVRFQKKDILGITVNSGKESLSASAFNLPPQPSGTPESSFGGSFDLGYGLQTYLISEEGEIDFPILGLIHAEGLSQKELVEKLKEQLKTYMKDEPIVTIRLCNFNISVLGEVNRPGQFRIDREKVNLLEALAMAGDMSIYGKRDRVQIMREESEGKVRIITVDISDIAILSSPYFYLQQNDIVYVEPNKTKANTADIGAQTGILISIGAMVLTLVNLILYIAQ
ncbi:polysaccharide export outer membrane protein [Bacteroidales bacterium]|nr:polysaccharide export outer membrane protein [Bacteroidales bacterium]